MAKGSKHSPALFEVVHGKKHFDKTARDTALRTPSWWFKGRKRMTDAGALAPAGSATAVEEAPPFGDADIPASAADPTENPSFLAARDREREAYRADLAEASAPADPMAIPSALTSTPRSRRRSPFQFVVDRDRHEVFVRVRYTTAVVAGVSLLVVVALAYITGRNVGRGPSSALASQTSEEIAAGAVEKGVLDFGSRTPNSNAGANAAPVPAFQGTGPAAQRPPAARVPQGTQSQPPSALSNPGRSPEPTPAAPPKNAARILQLNYVIVQGYPESEKQMALDASDALNKAGIPVTVERGVIGPWNGSWYYVVGVQGFAKASGAEYTGYVDAINKVSEKFAGRSRFKRFEPTPTKWRGIAN